MGPWATRAAIDEFREPTACRSAQLHCPAGRSALSCAILRCRPRGRMVGRHVDLRPYCLFDGEKVIDRPGRADARRAESRVDGRELVARRRQQGHLGAARITLMLSRIAESLFWMGRYMERAEDTARLLDVHFHTLLEQSQQTYLLRWDSMISISGEHEQFFKLHGGDAADGVRVPGVPRRQPQFDRRLHHAGAGKRANHSRSDLARAVGGHQQLLSPGSRVPRRDRKCSPALIGSAPRSSSRAISSGASPTTPCRTTKGGSSSGRGVRSNGRRKPPASSTSNTTRCSKAGRHASPINHQWMAVLKSVAAYEVYRREFHSSIDPRKVAELLVLHPRHPRSIRFNIARAPGVVAGYQPGGAAYLRHRSRATDREGSRSASLRPHRGHLRTRPARVPSQPAADVSSDRRADCPEIFLLCGCMNSCQPSVVSCQLAIG